MKNNEICGKLRKGANFAAAKNHDDRYWLKSLTMAALFDGHL